MSTFLRNRNNVVALFSEVVFYGAYIISFLQHTHFLSTQEPTTPVRRRVGLVVIWYLFAAASFDVASGVVALRNQDLGLWSVPTWLDTTLEIVTALSPQLTIILLHIICKEASAFTKFRISVMEMNTMALWYLISGVIDGNDHSALQNALCIFILCTMLGCEILFFSSIFAWLIKTLRVHPHPICQILVLIPASGVACSIILIACMTSILLRNSSLTSVLVGPMFQAACIAISTIAVRVSVKTPAKAAQADQDALATKLSGNAEASLLALRDIRSKSGVRLEEARPEEV
ncbi:hypothetical protein K488DRAFT_89289 [Vararia minispora EC-137]|uniref:Uncharacterized protein n=1 Tax=Vararia minispora EC-137 TaxID=1314806 RepID=A0ACB8QAZ1_9AGAM|nr:hypothetical protein K488DRAFT_89289 [Vararia minispora EC-137]